MRTFDRYLIRLTVSPFLLALTLFTFVLAVRPMLDYVEDYLARGVPLQTVGFLLLTLLPQALGVTLPIAFLTGLLMALGRLSADRESVALQACGASPARLLRPVMFLAVLVGTVDLYIMVAAIPDANQAFREVTFRYLAERGESDVKPRRFYEGFPGKVLYVQGADPEGGWRAVLLADTSPPGQPVVTLAESGRLVMDRERRLANLVLTRARQYRPGSGPETFETAFIDPLTLQIPAESVFGTGELALSRGNAEKRIADLRADIAAMREAGLSPHNEVMYLHQKFSFPVACLVFGPIGLALGLHLRREGRLAGLTVGLAVVFVYWAFFAQAEAWTKGQGFPAEWARWVPNLVLGAAGLVALWWRMRGPRPGRVPGARLVGRLRDRWEPAVRTAPVPRRWRQTTLVVWVPSLRLPRPRLLDLYVSGQYLRVLTLAFAALLGLYYLGAFLDRIEKLFKGQADGELLAAFLWYSTPQFVAFIFPIATLVAVLGTIGALTRTGELTVMRACGVSLYRAAVPLVLLAAVWSGVLFLMEERVLARANQEAERLDDVIRGNAPHTVNVIANRHWLAAPDGRIYYYLAYAPTRQELLGLSVFDTAQAPFRLVGQTFAERASFVGPYWQARHGWALGFPTPDMTSRETFDTRTLALAPPADFEGAQVDAAVMTVAELAEEIRRLTASGFSVVEQRLALQRKLAFPAVTIVMTLLAVPFAVTTGRQGALFGIGLAVVLAVAYFLLLTFFVAAGRAGILPPVLAAWATNLLFLAAAGYLTLATRT